MTTLRGLGLGLVVCCACSQGETSREEPARVRQGIVGQTDPTSSGAVALIRANSPSFVVLESTCSATLIAPNVALTARHCVEYLTASTGCSATFTGNRTHPYLAIRTEADVAAAGTPFVVSKIRVPSTTSACDGDIALLVLEASVPSEILAPIAARLAGPPVEGESFSAIGYGLTTAGGSIDGKRRRADGGQVACVGAGVCGASPFQWFGAPPTTCPGDSGGPALDAKGEVIGVSSRGQCGQAGSVAIYARTDTNAALIVSAVLEGAALGGYPAPAWAVVPSVPDAGAVDASTTDGGGVVVPDAAVSNGGETPAPASPAAAAPATATTDGCSVGHGQPRSTAFGIALGVLVAARLRRRRSSVARP